MLRVTHMQTHTTNWILYCITTYLNVILYYIKCYNQKVDWPFQFFDIESRCKFNSKLEGLNRIFQMYRLCPSWSQPWILRAHHYGWPRFCFWDNQSIECIVEEAENQYLTPHDDYDQLLPPLTSYRVSGEKNWHMWHMTWSPHWWVPRLWLDTYWPKRNSGWSETNNPRGSPMTLEVFGLEFCECSKGQSCGVL